jgi:hypothetical protein
MFGGKPRPQCSNAARTDDGNANVVLLHVTVLSSPALIPRCNNEAVGLRAAPDW